ncbi:hypothetical protein Fcan01_28272 [Folsomia candida]|uniref:Uncharacterized protein n=1 Tax=Folsomia candida TaxID=158441 RepID=A0A226CVE1_FOLCA|nr:hypothetical protein Fcan01_28272 [Folsomia candida]
MKHIRFQILCRFLLFMISVFVPESSTLNLTKTLFQYLDPNCHVILAQHNNFQHSQHPLSFPFSFKNGMYIFHLPQINISSWIRYGGPALNTSSVPPGIFSAIEKTKIPCSISVIVTQRSDFKHKIEDLSVEAFNNIGFHQSKALYRILYAKPIHNGYFISKLNPRSALVIQVQVDFDRVFNVGEWRKSAFRPFLNIILKNHLQEVWVT